MWEDVVVVTDFPLFFFLYFCSSFTSSSFYFFQFYSLIWYFDRSSLVLFNIVSSLGFVSTLNSIGSNCIRFNVVFLLSFVFYGLREFGFFFCLSSFLGFTKIDSFLLSFEEDFSTLLSDNSLLMLIGLIDSMSDSNLHSVWFR